VDAIGHSEGSIHGVNLLAIPDKALMLSFRRVGYGHANCPPGGRRRAPARGRVGAVAAPDAIVDPREADERPGDVRIVDTVVSPGEVRGETAELRLGVDLRHRGSAVENVTVRHRAIGADSGLLVDETTVDVGTVDGGGERTINGSVDVEREGGYRIETVVFADGERRASQTTRVGGVAALTPDYADSRVGFTESNVWPTVAVSVSEADNQTATLSVSLSVTNRGDAVSEPLDRSPRTAPAVGVERDRRRGERDRR